MIFLDLVLPEINGAQLFRRIREKNPDVPIAIITGYPDSELMAEIMEVEPLIIMKKPFDIADILKVVNSIAVKRELINMIGKISQ